MVIEWLTVKVPAAWHDRYIAADAAVWTQFLVTCPGYVGKQIWKNPVKPDEIVLIVHWQSRAQWKAIAPAQLAVVEARFREQLGQTFEIIASAEYVPVSDGQSA